MKPVAEMSDAELAYAAKDLGEVIANQEEMARLGHRCDKLGQYHDELSAVRARIERLANLRVKTTAGEVFAPEETETLAKLIFKRFGRDPETSASAWRRMLGNNCSTEQFMQLALA